MARRYSRDNRGRFASGGGGATARGGRLRTAAGNKRKTQTMQASAAPKGTIGKPRGLKPQSAKPAAKRKPLTGVNSVVGRNVAAFKGLPVSLRSRKQAASAQAAKRRGLLSRSGVSTGGTFKRGVNRQPNLLTGRVDRVGAGKFRPVSKRRDNNAAKPARAAAKPAAKPAPKAATSLQAVNARRARASAPRTSTYLSQKLNTQSAITRSAANAIYNRQRAVGKAGGLDKSVIRSPIGIMPKTSGSVRNRAEQVREAARKRVVGGRRR